MSNPQRTQAATGAGPEVGRATGFDLGDPGRADASNIEAALERNRAFAAAGATRARSSSPPCGCSSSRAWTRASTPLTSSASVSATRWWSATSAGG